MTNKLRGEVHFQQGAIDFVARPSFNLTSVLESELRLSVIQISAKARNLTMSYTEMVQIVEIAARCSPEPPPEVKNTPAFREAIFQEGPMKFYNPILELLTNIFATGRPEKNADEGKTKKK